MTQLTRRSFMVTGAAGGLLLGLRLPAGPRVAQASTALAPNAFVSIGTDNIVTVIAKHTEIGQGAYTGLATLLAEELDADWSQVRVSSAPADAEKYNNLHWGPVQGTGGSSAIANSWQQMREAGATARAMLVAAAAERWDVPAAEISVARGVVVHGASGQVATFGELVESASAQAVPESVTLKSHADFDLIGKHAPRLDSAAKSNGTITYTNDVQLDDMHVAVIARPDRFGGRIASFDASAAMKVRGVRKVVEVPRGVAVVANSTWAAIKGRNALVLEYDDSEAETRSTADIMAEHRALADEPGLSARREGDGASALDAAATRVDLDFEFPMLAHAPMEPLDAVAQVSADGVKIWTGSQIQTSDKFAAAAIAEVDPSTVTLHTLYAGGSFGRRATPESDMVAEAVSVAKAVGDGRPVKVIWTREDDIRGGRYRPLYFHRVSAGLDADGKLVAWEQRIVGQSILAGTPFEGMLVKDGIDATSVEGVSNLPYAVPNLDVSLHTTAVGVPPLWWRAVGSTHTAYSTEVMIDALARAGGHDPAAFRRALLDGHPRHLAALDLAVEKSGWGQAPPAGVGRGIALHESFNSVVAQVADVRITDSGEVKVERVVCAVDCGTAVNPDQVRAQMEGGIGFGLGAALRNEITLDAGRVVQSNFHDYQPVRLTDMPEIEVHIVPSQAAPTGVGEPGVPPIAPAVANAVAALSGQLVTKLPFSATKLGTA